MIKNLILSIIGSTTLWTIVFVAAIIYLVYQYCHSTDSFNLGITAWVEKPLSKATIKDVLIIAVIYGIIFGYDTKSKD